MTRIPGDSILVKKQDMIKLMQSLSSVRRLGIMAQREGRLMENLKGFYWQPQEPGEAGFWDGLMGSDLYQAHRILEPYEKEVLE